MRYPHYTLAVQFLIMRRTINVFTSLIFIYSLIVCFTCKQVSPDKVGNLELDALSSNRVETVPLKQTKKVPASEDAHFSTAAILTADLAK